MRRREFITGIASALAGSALTRGVEKRKSAHRRASRSAPDRQRSRIAVSSWSFHNYFAATRRRDFDQPGPLLALLDFPQMVVDRYKVHHFEFVAPHFASTERAYIQELRSRLQRTRSFVVNIPMDIRELHAGGGLSSREGSVQQEAIDAAKPWIDIARQLGARSVRCDPGDMNPEDLTPTIESYKKLAMYGKSKGVRVIIENHGTIGSEHPEVLVNIFKAVKSDFLGALPDFGNFPDEETRETGLRLLFPHAKTVCHAKGREFDPNGNETTFDFPKCVEISKKARYKGAYSIEYEGQGDPYDGVQKVIDELLRFL